MITAGVASAKDGKSSGSSEYSQTKRLLKIWAAGMKYQKRKAIAAKIAEHTHSSSSRVMKDTLPYLQEIFRKNKAEGDKIAEDLELGSEELDWLRK